VNNWVFDVLLKVKREQLT